MKKNIFLLFILMLCISCSGIKELQNSIRQFGANLEYPHDKQVDCCPKKDSVVIIMHDYLLNEKTTVRKGSMILIPLLFFNYFEQNYWVTLGQEAVNSRYDDFFIGNLTEESQRNGCFNIANIIASDSTYTLEIGIDTCYTRAKYKRYDSFHYYVYGYASFDGEYGITPKTTLKVSAALRRAGSVIFKKQYIIDSNILPETEHEKQDKDPRALLVKNMAISLSYSTKQCIEEMVTDINGALRLNSKQ